jgi:hypothetical protein|tara:strand:- start:346 stop:777 length:432 start_codon:yes stop_codon:yes gene_type:complete
MSKKKNERDFSKEVKEIADKISINKDENIELSDEDVQEFNDFEEIHHVLNNVINAIGLEEISNKDRMPVAVWHDVMHSIIMHIMMRTDINYVTELMSDIDAERLGFIDDWNNHRVEVGQMSAMSKESFEKLLTVTEDNNETIH